MPRIPEEEIDRIKRETDLAALVRSRGIELHKHGGNGHLAGKCPFHAEDEASFIVTPAKGLFHCMGCGAAGNAIQFIEKFDGVSFRHAFEILSAGMPAFSPSSDAPVKKTTVRRLEAPVTPDADDAALFAQVVDYYHERLLKTPAALEYLKGRGLFDEEAIEHFRLGFADRTIGLRLPDNQRKAGTEIRTRLQKLGLIRESGHEHFNGSIVLPVFDAEGNVAEMYGRKISRHLRKGTPLHLYLPGPHAGIWNPDALIGTAPDTLESAPRGELLLCEAPLDALTFWVNGIRNVTFIFGTEGFPDYLFDAMLTHRIKTVRLAYDADDAGNRAAERDAARLTAHGIEVYRIRFPHGMDVNEYAQKVQPAANSLAVAVKSAEWLGGSAAPPRPSCTRPPASSSLAANKIAASSPPEAGPPLAEAAEITANEEQGPEPRAAAPGQTTLTRAGDYHVAKFGQREYRVGGLEKNNGLDVLKVSVRLHHQDDFHLDSFDLTRDGDRRRFIERAAEETGLEKELIKRDLGRLLLALEEAQQERLSSASQSEVGNLRPKMSAEERREAQEFLTAPDLVERLIEAFPACGLAGEVNNLLAGYISCTSRLLEKPLAVIIQSTSAAGKSTLMEAVLAMFPEEERIKYSAMTGQSLYYLGDTNLKHKILAIVEEEGAEKASYALKLLQSEGELTIASTGKNPTSGRMETQVYHVEGPVMIFLTTTAIEIDEELLNRCLVLTVDESREQTERIHTLQRQARTLDGLHRKKRKQKLLTLLRNAQRLLEPMDIVNPWADRLTFTAERTRTRRDHEKYLTLIDSIALLHQHQRSRDQMSEGSDQTGGQYITVTLDDIALANRLAPDLLGRSLDELPPQTRRLLDTIKSIIREQCIRDEMEQEHASFSRGELRQRLGWSEYQVRVHLAKLEGLEYVARRWGRQGKRCSYELLAEIKEASNTSHIGLLDVAKLGKSARPPTSATTTSCIQEATSGNFVEPVQRSATSSTLVACG